MTRSFRGFIEFGVKMGGVRLLAIKTITDVRPVYGPYESTEIMTDHELYHSVDEYEVTYQKIKEASE